jgi:CHAT domain-containing protein/tetratricopeptide (TPR) repeat protein
LNDLGTTSMLRGDGRARLLGACLVVALCWPLSAVAQAPDQGSALERAQQAQVAAWQLQMAGKVTEAIPAAQRAVSLWEALAAEHASDLVDSLITLGTLQLRGERYPEAAQTLRRALVMLERQPESDRLATVLNNFGHFQLSTGNALEAEYMFRRALDVLRRLPGPHAREIAATTNALAEVLRRRGDLKGAEDLARRALAITEGDRQAEPTELATRLNNLASVLKSTGAYAEAEALLRRSLDLIKRAVPAGDPKIAQGMANLSVVLLARERFADAEENAMRALELFTAARYTGQEIIDAADVLVFCFWANDDIFNALRFHGLVAQDHERTMARILTMGTRAQKAEYVDGARSELDVAVSMHLHSAPNNALAARAALTEVLSFKGRVLDAGASDLRRILASDQGAIRKRLARILEARRKFAAFILEETPEERATTEHQQYKTELSLQSYVLERSLNEVLSTRWPPPPPVTVDAVAATLTPNSALIELCVFWPVNPRKPGNPKPDDAHYAAYVLLPGAEIAAIDLGPISAIDPLVARAHTAFSTNGAAYEPAARALYAKLMRPLLPLLKGATGIFFSPDGQLNLLPVAALIDDQNQFLLRRFRFTYLDTGRELLHLAQRAAPRSGPVVYAAPDYGAGPTPTLAPGGRASSLPSRMRFDPLPGTLEEAKSLTGVLKLPPGALRTGNAASETSLVALHGPSVLHLATHGFLRGNAGSAPGETRGAEVVTPQPAQGQTASAASAGVFDDPLLWSGIALAGANDQAGQLDDGVVTALELAGMDLWGTQLVTLSACETGLGSVHAGDGVYGLRRALVLAGAETQLTTLWKVADAETAAFMADYYRRLERGEGRSEALRRAQLALVGKHPFYWAAFTISGDPTPLHGAPEAAPVSPAAPSH